MDLNISDTKLLELKKKFIYFNHHLQLNTIHEADSSRFPVEYLRLSETNKSDTVIYYNIHMGRFIFENDKDTLNKSIGDFLDSFTDSQLVPLIKKFDENFLRKLGLRTNQSYTVELNRLKKTVTSELITIYSSKYENEEILKILLWLSQIYKGKQITEDFGNYSDRQGKLLKGKIINDIKNNLNAIPSLHSIIEKAYNSKLRHLFSHANMYLNQDTKEVININEPLERITFSEVYESFYAVQQLDNYIRFFVYETQIDPESIINRGIIGAYSTLSEDKTNKLVLLQLKPFFDYDMSEQSNPLEIVSELKDGNLVISSNNNELIQLPLNSSLEEWFSVEGNSAEIQAIVPNIYNNIQTHLVYPLEDDEFLVLNSARRK